MTASFSLPANNLVANQGQTANAVPTIGNFMTKGDMMIITAGSRLSSTDSHIDDCYGSLIFEAEAELGAFLTAML